MSPRSQILKLKLAATLGLNPSFDADCDGLLCSPAFEYLSGEATIYRLAQRCFHQSKRASTKFSMYWLRVISSLVAHALVLLGIARGQRALFDAIPGELLSQRELKIDCSGYSHFLGAEL